MSVIAGAYSRQPNSNVPLPLCDSIRQLISRNSGDEICVFEDGRSYIAKLDIGAFAARGELVGDDGTISLLAGEPLLFSVDDSEPNRLSDLRRIQESLGNDNFDVLREAHGAFCAANFQPDTGCLKLITDKLGVRPLYYWFNDDLVIFSSALRILEGLSEIPKQMDVRAVTEIAGLSYALGNRTPYINIFVLNAGEILQVNGPDISREIYWDWNEIEPSAAGEVELLDELYARFQKAVARRLGSDTSTIAYLSGGLDSRCVVAALCDQGAHAHTFNFARPNTQDLIFGRRFADMVNVTHTELPKEAGNRRPDYSTVMVKALAASAGMIAHPPERPSVAWSGEGGSVVMGHVHLSRKIVEQMRAGDRRAAIDEFIRREFAFIPSKVLNSDAVNDIAAIIPEGINEELGKMTASDPARSFYLFLILNDQRRKLASHFENIDQHRLELQIPFFDSSFVELIVSMPVDMCLEHRAYTRWLNRFPAAVTAVPWQSYPGHEPCPLPVPDGLEYQWERGYQVAELKAQKQEVVRQANQIISAKNFAGGILNRNAIRLATLAHKTGWRDYGYIIETVSVYQNYWTKCDGNYSFSRQNCDIGYS
ncbi:N/A [soil metagenome]